MVERSIRVKRSSEQKQLGQYKASNNKQLKSNRRNFGRRNTSNRMLAVVLLSLVGSLDASSFAFINKAKKPVVEMNIESSFDHQPVKTTGLEDRSVVNSVLRHHVVKQEVNSHINLQDFMRAAAEKTKLTVNSQLEEDDNPQDIIESELVQVEKLPDFDVCPIMPELPGEGSIRKVREIERQNVEERVQGKVEIIESLA